MIKNYNPEDVFVHKPVLVKEINQAFGLIAPLKYQADVRKKIIIDATLGGGGHAWEFIMKGAFVLGIDADEEMVKIAGNNLRKAVDSKFACPTGNYENFFKIVNANFSAIDRIADENGVKNVWAILFDLGISSYHYLFENRGFSFKKPDSLLDMRLSDRQEVTASNLLNALSKDNLTELFSITMPHFRALKLSKGILEFRKIRAIQTVKDMLDIVSNTISANKSTFHRGKDINPATLPFLALRIAVNTELDNLKTAIVKSWNLLDRGGKLAVISFHSGEDKIVKEYFEKLVAEKKGVFVKKIIIPGKDEIEENPRARSAKLRIIYKS